ncbi:ABC transporter permease [Streptomyces sp. CMB-StM0423]|uniref:ABC transporter permease n=1 Tax=Streptomyces sp. CMB-StM0423 TaxID=2059884 RepID=UPI000C7037E4|nr:ABC transporter permease [Streptomyces sp. CMB-StM0423]AUH42669.1 ABC transporter [Streptomyces sp. CMB-StM0423]
MLRTALRNVFAHKARLLMTVLAVMLGVAFVSGTLVFTSTISDAYTKSSEQGFDHVDVRLQPDDDADEGRPGEPPPLTQDLLDEAAALPGVKSATGNVAGFAALADKDGDLVGDGWSTSGANYYPGDGGKGEDPRYPMRDGRGPENANEIAIDAKTAERTGYEVGDTPRMSVDGPVLEPVITGVFTTDDGNVAAGGSLVLFDTKTAQDLFTKPGEYTEIDLAAAPGTSEGQLRAEAQKILPAEAEALTGTKLADDQARQIEQGMDGLRTAMLAFAGIALFVGIFLIANTFTMLVAQRTKELALLRAVGASRRQVTRSVLFEATAVGTAAALTGLAAGVGIGAGLRSLMSATGETVPDGPLVVSPATVVISLVVGIVVTVLAAWLPARRAAKIPPVAAMSSLHAQASTRSLVVRNIIGALIGGIGAVMVVAGTTASDGKALMGIGAAVLLVGIFVLTPLLSRPVIALGAPLLRVFGVSGKLARQNAVRNPRRTAATASALMIGLTLITSLTVIAGGVANAIDKMATDAMKADYSVSMTNFTPLNPEVGEKLAGLDEVTAASPLRTVPVDIGGDDEDLTGVNGETVGKLVELDFEQGSFAGLAEGVPAGGGPAKAIVDTDTAEDEGWKMGDTVQVTYQDGEKGELAISGLYKGNEMLSGIMLDTSVVSPHLDRITDFEVWVKTAGGESDAMKDKLEAALGDNPAIAVMDEEDVSEMVAGLISMMLNVLYAMLGMAVLVAVLGVINTLAMSVFERSQEIGMLRAIGLDRRAVKRMVRLESLVISLFGGVLGIGLGVFLGWAAGELIASSIDTYSLVLPWERMAYFLLGAALVGMLAALWPARRASRLNMLAAIKSE